ncbi:MAG: exosortase system-associated protein, TIGR04073 family [Candidatus Omnitrophota bacterium]
MKKIMSLVVILSMLLAPVAFAASPWTEEKTYGDRVTGKLVFGLQNTLLGWIQLFAVPNQYANEGKNVWSGIGQGLVEATVCTFGGALQLVTFAIPADLPLPNNGVDLSGSANVKK